MTGSRIESDSMGEIQVESSRYWGAQTERSLHHFSIGDPASERMPLEVVHAMGVLKKAAAMVNRADGQLEAELARLIIAAADEVIDGTLDEHFPLFVWQTGSGTQTNMNVERGHLQPRDRDGGGRDGVEDARPPERPREHVAVLERHVPHRDAHRCRARWSSGASCRACVDCATRSAARAKEFADIVKIGRTHLQDAVPLTLGQEFGGYVAQLDADIVRIELDAAGPLRARDRRNRRRYRLERAGGVRRGDAPRRSPS